MSTTRNRNVMTTADLLDLRSRHCSTRAMYAEEGGDLRLAERLRATADRLADLSTDRYLAEIA